VFVVLCRASMANMIYYTISTVKILLGYGT
jgi:hypothetical protein